MSEQYEEPVYGPAIERSLLITRLKELTGEVALSAFEFTAEAESVQVLSGLMALTEDEEAGNDTSARISVLYYSNFDKQLAKVIGFPNPLAYEVYNLRETTEAINKYAEHRDALVHARFDASRRKLLENAVFSSELSHDSLSTMLSDQLRFQVAMRLMRLVPN